MFTLKEIAKVVDAKNDWSKWSGLVIDGLEFDTRKIQANDLFVPLKGTRDGHEFIEEAKKNGAIACFWESGTIIPQPRDFAILVVDDCLAALQKLAHYYRMKINPKVVAITGSNGKTTTKDMVAAVLGEKYNTYKTQGNYNNEIGLPYTILHMPQDTEALVLEMGMDRRDEIRPLSELAMPDIAAITIIGESHIEYLGSRQGIAEAKMEIVDGLKKDGQLIVPGSELLLEPLVSKCSQIITTFGQTGKEFLHGVITERSKNSVKFTTNKYGTTVFEIPVVGDYNVNNALIAIEIASYFDVPPAQIQTGLMKLDLTHSRAEWMKAWNGADILNDAYNANPTAMALVLQTFGKLETEEAGDKVAVLADMAELGENSPKMHRELVREIDESDIQTLLLYGPLMQNLENALKEAQSKIKVVHFNVDEKVLLTKKIQEILQPNDMILFKGSNSMKLNEIIQEICIK